MGTIILIFETDLQFHLHVQVLPIKLFQKSGLSFPIIVKPEIGERGWLVARIDSMDQLKKHVKANPIDLILQPFVQLPMEVSIMVYKMPDGSISEVTSICEKEFLHIEGDGQSTIEQLILSEDRALLQYNKLKKKLRNKDAGNSCSG